MSLRISLLFLFGLVSFHLFAGDSTQTWIQWKKDWDKRKVKSSGIHLKKDKSLIGSIEILDVRSDTERIGIYINDRHKPGEFILDTSFRFLLNDQFSSDASHNTLLLVIRSFWINEIQNFSGNASKMLISYGTKYPVSQLRLSADVFIKQEDKYVPLTHVDTILVSKDHVLYAAPFITAKALAVLQNELEEAIAANLFTGKKPTSKENIERVYSKRFQIAALKDTAFRKGVYWSQHVS